MAYWNRGKAKRKRAIEIGIRYILKDTVPGYASKPDNDPNLRDTPERVAEAFVETWCAGYGLGPEDVLTTFPNPGRQDLVVVKDIPLYSMCSHHLAPFFGKAAIGYVPNRKVVGLSKMDRLLNVYARRLQLQEQITHQVAEAFDKHLQPLGVMVILYDMTHTCMTSRGVKAHGSTTTTSAVRGLFETDSSLRAEFLALLK